MSKPVKIRVLQAGKYKLPGGITSEVMVNTTINKVYDAVWKDVGEPDGVAGGSTTADAVEFFDDKGDHKHAQYYPDRMEIVEG